MLLYREESTFFPNRSIMSLTFGLIGVLTELENSKPNFFTRFLAYLDWDMNNLILADESTTQGSDSTLQSCSSRTWLAWVGKNYEQVHPL